ncbi:MAG: S-adenosylmethionine synthetase N-terminal domain-containing protein [Pseudonocardiaceae bacterium]
MNPSLPGAQIAESVCAGHPGKVADQISDAVVDAYLVADPLARVHCEVLLTRGLVVAAGQVSTAVDGDVEASARGVLWDVGSAHYRPTATFGHFGRESEGFPWEKRDLVTQISRQ